MRWTSIPRPRLLTLATEPGPTLGILSHNKQGQDMEKIGFIGLGRMGKPMAANLRKKGFELVVMDLNREAVAELVALGASAGESVAQVARDCAIVVTMLPSSVEVEQVALGADGLFANAAPGSLLLDM